MRAYKRLGKHQAGFTLVELMIVVAIIGVLAALAIYGVNKYLASAKTAEAKNTVGAITRGATAAYARETYANQLLADGAASTTAMNVLCNSVVTPAPATFPTGKKVQPSTAPGVDFNAGDNVTGWKCLNFSMSQPTYYQFNYVTGAGSGNSGADATGFEVTARGDLNGDAIQSLFARGAVMRNKQIVLSTTIFIQNENE